LSLFQSHREFIGCHYISCDLRGNNWRYNHTRFCDRHSLESFRRMHKQRCFNSYITECKCGAFHARIISWYLDMVQRTSISKPKLSLCKHQTRSNQGGSSLWKPCPSGTEPRWWKHYLFPLGHRNRTDMQQHYSMQSKILIKLDLAVPRDHIVRAEEDRHEQLQPWHWTYDISL